MPLARLRIWVPHTKIPLLNQTHVQNFVFEMNFFQEVSWHCLKLGLQYGYIFFEYSTLTGVIGINQFFSF